MFSAKLGELPIMPANVLFRVVPAAVRDTVLVVELTGDAVVRFGFQYLDMLSVNAVAKCVRFAAFPEVTLALLGRAAVPYLMRAAAAVTTPSGCEKFVDIRSTVETGGPVRVAPLYGRLRGRLLLHGDTQRTLSRATWR